MVFNEGHGVHPFKVYNHWKCQQVSQIIQTSHILKALIANCSYLLLQVPAIKSFFKDTMLHKMFLKIIIVYFCLYNNIFYSPAK